MHALRGLGGPGPHVADTLVARGQVARPDGVSPAIAFCVTCLNRWEQAKKAVPLMVAAITHVFSEPAPRE